MWRFVRGLSVDLGYAWLAVRRRPGSLVNATLVLACGIGLSTGVFGFVNAVLLRPLPVRAPDQLVYLSWSSIGGPSPVSEEDFRALQEHMTAFGGLTGHARDVAGVRVGDRTARIVGERVAPGYFEVLGVSPALGRGFREEEQHAAARPTPVVVSYRLWQGLLAGHPDVVGSEVEFDRGTYVIVGVMPERFLGTLGPWAVADYWVPIAPRASHLLQRRPAYVPAQFTSTMLIARLRPGDTAKGVQPAITVIGRRLREGRPAGAYESVLAVRRSPWAPMPLDTSGAVSTERLAAGLMAVAVVVLMVAVGNLAFVFAAQAVGRTAEYAVKLALGSSRARLVRQAFVETLILGVAGSTAGIGMAALAMRAAAAVIPSEVNGQPISLKLALDPSVLVYALAMGIVVGVLGGLVPALRILRMGGYGTGAGGQRGSTRSALALMRGVVVPQIAFTLLLLIPAGGLLKSMFVIDRAPLGFIPAGRVYVRYDLDDAATPKSAVMARDTRHAELGRRVPDEGERAWRHRVAFASSLPWDNERAWFQIGATSDTPRHRNLPSAEVSPGYFGVLGIPILQGRDFNAGDTKGSAPVVVVSQELARTSWPGSNPIGQRLAPHEPGSPLAPRWYDVVGVVGDVRPPLREPEAGMAVYRAVAQAGVPTVVIAWPVQASPKAVGQISTALQTVDPDVVTYRGGGTVDSAVRALRAPWRIGLTILGAAGVGALWLAMVGLYGVISFSAQRRSREMGIRAALGARPAEIVRLFLKDGLVLVLLGAVSGSALAVLVRRIAPGVVRNVVTGDLGMFAGVVLLVVAISLVACYVPARRAAAADPAAVLRQD